jgi:acyl-CoA dehydrogenase
MAATEQAVAGGVSFALTDEQKELRALAREFAAKEIRPVAAEHDVHMRHPVEVIAKAHEVGLMNLHIPAAYGGPGLGSFDGMLVGEEVNWGCTGIGTSIGANGLGAGPVLIAGTDEQKAKWLPPLLEAPILCSFALSEPEAGSDVARLKTTAERRGDEYVLNGSKTFITNAGYADWAVVFAKTDVSKGHRGMSAFIVPMDAPGVTIEQHLDKMGQRATDTSAFALQDVIVPAANRLGEEGQGFKLAMQTLDVTRPGTAIGAVGVAQAAYELAVEYAKERVTFDVPIAMHQGVNFMIADMATETAATVPRSTRRSRSASRPTRR